MGGDEELIPGWPASGEHFSVVLDLVESRAGQALARARFLAADLAGAYLSRGAELLLMEGPRAVAEATVVRLDDGSGELVADRVTDRQFSAQIELLPTRDGGLREAMPLPTPSLILVFESLGKGSPAELQIGGRIAAPARSSLRAADALQVTIEFWDDLGRVYATPGTRFKLWYAGRVVGGGRFRIGANDPEEIIDPFEVP
ncbi:hypothetical protein [Luteipulveratus mongoliensis]|uniref:hypothetical protein n=1 Tax=Luteipulveratus mongoliensis TaxID=571913 RepID=UPI0012ED80AC|nr:hypothetical protein [Luteipulveratus mongoliensis]